MTYIYHYFSPLGGITVSSNGSEVTGLWFDGQKYFGDTLPNDYKEKALPIFEETIMLTIPFGQTMTYGEIADSIAKQRGLAKMSAFFVPKKGTAL